MDTVSPTLRLHLWLETPEGMLLGLGRAELLLRIQETGSLNQAAKAMSMSYRAAWGRLKASEAMAGEPLVEKSRGQRGFVLTPLGERLARSFKEWHADVEAYALKRAAAAFPWPVRPFEETGGREDAHG
ncbi:MAG: winged helix-turn-helix domain-containing protein [Thermodesulfobacteriota bacterium]